MPGIPGPRPSRRRLLLFLSIPIVLLVLGEIGMRLTGDDEAGLPALLAPPPEGALSEDGRPIFRGMKDLTKPHLDGVFRGADYRSDAISFRGPDRPREPAPGTRRVIVTGDSVALGSGVEENEAFPAATEAWLNREAAPPRWEVLDAAMAGANAAFALRRLQRGIDHYGADLYVYSFSPNDIEGPAYRHFPAERTAVDLIEEAGWPARSSSALLRATAWWWHDLAARIEALNLAHHAREIHFNYFENPAAWRDLLEQLDRLAAMAERDDRCAIFLMLTRLGALDPEDHPYVEIYDVVASEAAARGLHVIDTRSLFFGRDARTVRLSTFDPHPNVEGHAMIAEALGEGIRALPPGCWTD